MAEVLHGDGNGNQLNARTDKTQVYGLKGNDTMTADGKRDVLLVGGSGDDSLIMSGGNGTLSGGKGSDTFELTYSATKPLSAVIEDLEPSSDKIVVNFDGNTVPTLNTVTSGSDVILRDGTRLNVTLKGVRENDYFDGDASDEAWEVLKLTNAERERQNLPALTMSDGLTAGASIRVQEITALGESGVLDVFKHDRPGGASYATIFDDAGKTYRHFGENIQAGAASPEEVMKKWIDSPAHYANIVNPDFQKLGVGYNYDDSDPSNQRYYWEQLFGSTVNSPAPETVDVSTASPEVRVVSKNVTLTEGDDTYSNSDYGVTLAGLGGNDSISNSGRNVSISGGADNDSINNSGTNVTINAGTGNDSINLNAAQDVLIQYAAGDGSDTVSGLNATDTVNISGGEYTSATVGNDVVLGVGDDSITLTGAAKLDTLNVVGMQKNFFTGTEGDDSINNTVEGAIIAALGGNDTIYNGRNNVSINAGTGDDSVYSYGNNVTFFHESGNDTISGLDSYYNSTLKVAGGSYASLISNDYYYNSLILIDSESGDSINILDGGYYSPINIADANGKPVTVKNALDIVGTEDADSLNNTFNSATIRAKGGDDTIANGGATVSIDAGNGNDSIDNIAAQVTISGGAGNDYVNNNQQLLTVYNYTGGNETLEGFNTSDSLNVGNYNYSTVTDDDGNIVISMLRGSATVGSVTLKDYSGTYINVVSTYSTPTVRGRSVSNERDSVSVIGSAGNDTITSSGNDVSIRGDAGNDTINLGGASNVLIQYTSGDGNDVVNGLNETSTLRIGDGSDTYATQKSGSDVIARVGNGSVILAGATSLATVNILGIESYASGSIIALTEGDDEYYNEYGEYATIQALGGDDSVGSWNDNVSIDGGAGNDSIRFGNINVTVTGGAGDDSIYDDTDIAAHVYTGGNDTIYAFDRWSTIVIADSYSTQRNDRNVEISVQGKGTLTLENYWSDVNIVSSLDKVTHYNIFYSGEDNAVITGTNDADYFRLFGDSDSITVDAQDGNDFFDYAEGMNNSLNAGAGDDTVSLASAGNATVLGGTGKNLFVQWGSAGTAYVYGGGNDTIQDFNQLQTLVIADSWTSISSNSGLTINVTGKGTITIPYWSGNLNIVSSLAEAKRYNTIVNGDSYANVTGTSGDDFVRNDYNGSNALINVAGGNDAVNNWGANSSINGGSGSDSISNHNGSNTTIDGGDGDDTINNYNGTSNVVLNGDTGNDEIYNNNRSSFVTMNGDAGNDYLWNSGANVTIDGGADNDTFYSYGSYNSSIDGGAGNDYILQGWHSDNSIFGDDSTLTGGDGDDNVDNYGGQRVSIDGGEGNDLIWNENVTIWNSTTQQSETVSSPDNATIDGGAGSDTVYNYGSSVSIDGGAGNDYIDNYGGQRVSINGGAGNDSIYNEGSNVLIDGGDGSDTVWNNGSSVSIDGGAGDDYLWNSGTNVSMLGGAGDDQIDLSSYSSNNFVRYADGDGNDTVWGITENDTLNFLADESLVSSTIRGDDLIFYIGSGSVLLIGARDKPPHITYGESGTSGGGSNSGNDNDGNSSGGNGGNSGGSGQSGGNTSGGTSSNEGNIGAASGGGRSASGSAGRSESNRSGNSFRRNEHSTTANAPTATSNVLPDPVAQLNHQTTATTQQTSTTSTTATRHVYTGGNQVIADYAAGEKIIFGATYTGAFYDGNGNFFAGSTTGALVVQNAADKVIDLRDVAGNAFVKAYAATTAGVIDGRGLLGFEVINGSAGSDAIYAGNGGSQLWGGADSVSDAMMGGNGTDIFIGGRTQGADFFLNASSADIVHLNDTTLSDIVATVEENGTIGIAFNTGNVVAVQSSEALSATVMLADGSAYRFNHANKSWQTA